VGATHPLTKMDAPYRTLQNIKDKQNDQPAKKTYDILLHPRVASVETLWSETIHFQNARICKMFCTNVCTNMRLHWKPLHPLCSCLATGLTVNTEHAT
jgi:hypothetical protein